MSASAQPTRPIIISGAAAVIFSILSVWKSPKPSNPSARGSLLSTLQLSTPMTVSIALRPSIISSALGAKTRILSAGLSKTTSLPKPSVSLISVAVVVAATSLMEKVLLLPQAESVSVISIIDASMAATNMIFFRIPFFIFFPFIFCLNIRAFY